MLCFDPKKKKILWFHFHSVQESIVNIKGVNTVSRMNTAPPQASVTGTPSLIAFVEVSPLKTTSSKTVIKSTGMEVLVCNEVICSGCSYHIDTWARTLTICFCCIKRVFKNQRDDRKAHMLLCTRVFCLMVYP